MRGKETEPMGTFFTLTLKQPLIAIDKSLETTGYLLPQKSHYDTILLSTFLLLCKPKNH